MLVKIKNTSSRLKAIPGLPGVRHFIKPGETKVVELPDDLSPKKSEAWARAGLSVWYDPVEKDAPVKPEEPDGLFKAIQDAAKKPAAPVTAVPAPSPAAKEKAEPPKAQKKSQPDAPSEKVDEAPAAPAPWQKGLEAPK